MFEDFYYTDLFHGIDKVNGENNNELLFEEESNVNRVWNWKMIENKFVDNNDSIKLVSCNNNEEEEKKLLVNRKETRISITLRKAKNEKEIKENLEGEKEKMRLSSWWKNAVNDV